MFSDDTLMHQLVLKGGNALRLAYGIGSRASLDFDFSLANDFEDPEMRQSASYRLYAIVSTRLDTSSLTRSLRRFRCTATTASLGRDTPFDSS